MAEDHQFSVSEPASFIELSLNTAIQKAKPRKVQFSNPLEHWREFDKETGEMYELNDSKTTHEENMKQQLKNTCDKDQDTDNSQDKLDCKGAVKTQSITQVIQAFQKRQYRRIDVSKQTQEKPRQDFNAVTKKNAKSSSSSFVHSKQLKNSPLLCNVSTCSKLATDGEFSLNLRKEPSLIQSYCTYSFSSSMGMLTSFTVSQLPLVSNSRKLYDERLLPRPVFTSVERKYNSMKTAKYGSGLPPVGKLTTPHIVQLFD